MPRFLLQIVDTTRGTVLKLPAGGQIERDLITACTDRIVRKGVGIWKTERQVRAAIADGITETIQDLKQETLYVA